MFSEKFICAGYDYTTYTFHVPAPYFRKTFEIDGEVKKCVITLTGLGFYELYVNGQRLTKGILAPYISNPDDLVYYDEYDITESLVPGKNVLGICSATECRTRRAVRSGTLISPHSGVRRARLSASRRSILTVK